MKPIENFQEIQIGDKVCRVDENGELKGKVTEVFVDEERIEVELYEDYNGDDEGEIYSAYLGYEDDWYWLELPGKYPRIKTKFLEGFQP